MPLSIFALSTLKVISLTFPDAATEGMAASAKLVVQTTGTEGTVSSQISVTTPGTAAYRFRVTSRDGATPGDYTFRAKWAPQRTFTFRGVLGKGFFAVPFHAEAGSKVVVTARASNGSAALPRIDGIRSEGFSVNLSDEDPPAATDRAGPITLPDTAEYGLDVRTDDTEAEIQVVISVTPPRATWTQA